MKAFLLYKNRDFELPQKLSSDERFGSRQGEAITGWNAAAHDFDARQKLPSNEDALMQDLELTTLFTAMAQGDDFLFEIAKKAVLSGLSNDAETIFYRQDILKDCINNATLVLPRSKLSKASENPTLTSSADILRRFCIAQ